MLKFSLRSPAAKIPNLGEGTLKLWARTALMWEKQETLTSSHSAINSPEWKWGSQGHPSPETAVESRQLVRQQLFTKCSLWKTCHPMLWNSNHKLPKYIYQKQFKFNNIQWKTTPEENSPPRLPPVEGCWLAACFSPHCCDIELHHSSSPDCAHLAREESDSN